MLAESTSNHRKPLALLLTVVLVLSSLGLLAALGGNSWGASAGPPTGPSIALDTGTTVHHGHHVKANLVGVNDWTQFQGGPAHNGLSMWPGPTNNTTLWTYSLGGSADSLTEYKGNLIVSEPYVTKAGWLAINASTGTEAFGGYTAHTLLGDPTTLATSYIPEGSGQTLAESYCNFCFLNEGPWLTSDNASTGSGIWNAGISPASAASAIYGYGLASYNKGSFYFGLYDGTGISAYYPNGTGFWSATLPGDQTTLPTFGNGLMLEGFSNLNEIAALWSSNGSAAWTYSTNGAIYGSPAYANGHFLVGSWGGTAYSLSTQGTLNWEHNLTTFSFLSSPVEAQGVSYFAATNGELFALNNSTGTTLWTDNLSGGIEGSPVIGSNGILYIGTEANDVYALDATTGSVLWKAVTTGNITQSPLLYGGRLYVTDQSGTVYAYGGKGYLVNFVESGLPSGTPWNVSVGGSRLTSHASVIAFTLANGTWSFKVSGPSGYVASPAQGTFSVSGAELSLTVSFAPAVTRTLYALEVNVADSSDQPLVGADVSVNGTTEMTGTSGEASFSLTNGTYNVSASDSSYNSSYAIVDLNSNETVALTLATPYHFLGILPSSYMNVTPTGSGFLIAVLDPFNASNASVFFNWDPIGEVIAGAGWTTFSFDQLPDLVVIAAVPGSTDYPNAWYAQPLSPVLSTSSGNESVFATTPYPYVSASISITPDPPTVGEEVTLTAILQNSHTFTLNLSQVDYQVSGLNVGGNGWTSVGFISNVTLTPGEVEPFSVEWNATESGHHCVRVVVSYDNLSEPAVAMQHNYEIEADQINGQDGSVGFVLGNPLPTTESVSIATSQQTPAGWTYSLEVNGEDYGNESQFDLSMAAGAQVSCTLTITPYAATPGNGTVDVTESVGGQLIGGIRKLFQELPPGELPVVFTETGLPTGTPWSVTFNGTSMSSDAESITFTALDGTYSYSVPSVVTYSASPNSGSVTLAGTEAQVAVPFSTSGTAPTFSLAVVNNSISYAVWFYGDQSVYQGDVTSQSHFGLYAPETAYLTAFLLNPKNAPLTSALVIGAGTALSAATQSDIVYRTLVWAFDYYQQVSLDSIYDNYEPQYLNVQEAEQNEWKQELGIDLADALDALVTLGPILSDLQGIFGDGGSAQFVDGVTLFKDILDGYPALEQVFTAPDAILQVLIDFGLVSDSSYGSTELLYNLANLPANHFEALSKRLYAAAYPGISIPKDVIDGFKSFLVNLGQTAVADAAKAGIESVIAYHTAWWAQQLVLISPGAEAVQAFKDTFTDSFKADLPFAILQALAQLITEAYIMPQASALEAEVKAQDTLYNTLYPFLFSSLDDLLQGTAANVSDGVATTYATSLIQSETLYWYQADFSLVSYELFQGSRAQSDLTSFSATSDDLNQTFDQLQNAQLLASGLVEGTDPPRVNLTSELRVPYFNSSFVGLPSTPAVVLDLSPAVAPTTVSVGNYTMTLDPTLRNASTNDPDAYSVANGSASSRLVLFGLSGSEQLHLETNSAASFQMYSATSQSTTFLLGGALQANVAEAVEVNATSAIAASSDQSNGTFFLDQPVAPSFTYDSNSTAINCTVRAHGVSNSCSQFLSGDLDTGPRVGMHSYLIVLRNLEGVQLEFPVKYLVHYAFSGFNSPLLNASVFRSGASVLVGFQLLNWSGTSVRAGNVTIVLTHLSRTQLFRATFNSSSNSYSYLLRTKGLARGQYVLSVQLRDGTTHSVVFWVRG